MIPWTLLGTAIVPGGDEMRLYQRGTEYAIRVANYELMNSRVHGSEDALATVVCDRLAGRPLRVLIGGLGMGFTLLAVLERVTPDSSVVVSELVPEVVQWHRGPLAVVSRGALDDPRVSVVEVDVARVIREARDEYDAILLDVDNGPVGLTAPTNDQIYTPAGLRAAYAALRPRGIFAVWSAGPHPPFTKRLRDAGFEAEEVAAHGHGRKGGRYLIWLAQRA